MGESRKGNRRLEGKSRRGTWREREAGCTIETFDGNRGRWLWATMIVRD